LQVDQQPPWVYGAPLLPHQLQACAWLRNMWLQRHAAVLADDQGLGKTASAAAYIGSLLQEFKSTAPVLIVAPLATLSFWEGKLTRLAMLGALVQTSKRGSSVYLWLNICG
jgi:SNF2 family DNA or RNA helicase